MIEQSKKNQVFARLDPALFRRLESTAGARFQGNNAMTVRAALDLYTELYERFGPRMDVVVAELMSGDPVMERAA